jgi:hypothetical protein
LGFAYFGTMVMFSLWFFMWLLVVAP